MERGKSDIEDVYDQIERLGKAANSTYDGLKARLAAMIGKTEAGLRAAAEDREYAKRVISENNAKKDGAEAGISSARSEIASLNAKIAAISAEQPPEGGSDTRQARILEARRKIDAAQKRIDDYNRVIRTVHVNNEKLEAVIKRTDVIISRLKEYRSRLKTEVEKLYSAKGTIDYELKRNLSFVARSIDRAEKAKQAAFDLRGAIVGFVDQYAPTYQILIQDDGRWMKETADKIKLIIMEMESSVAELMNAANVYRQSIGDSVRVEAMQHLKTYDEKLKELMRSLGYNADDLDKICVKINSYLFYKD